MDRRIWIVVGFLVLAVLGFCFVFYEFLTNGSVMSGSVVGVRVDNEVFRISDFGSENIEINSTEVKNGEGGSR